MSLSGSTDAAFVLTKKGMAKLSSRGGVVPHGAALTCTGCFIIGYRTIYTISTVRGTLATNKQTNQFEMVRLFLVQFQCVLLYPNKHTKKK